MMVTTTMTMTMRVVMMMMTSAYLISQTLRVLQ